MKLVNDEGYMVNDEIFSVAYLDRNAVPSRGKIGFHKPTSRKSIEIVSLSITELD